jgi:transcriptional regulator with XRE-family HTH domain
MKGLKEERMKLKLSQVEVAKRLNIERSTYSGYENGSREIPARLLPGLRRIMRMTWLKLGRMLETHFDEKFYGHKQDDRLRDET